MSNTLIQLNGPLMKKSTFLIPGKRHMSRKINTTPQKIMSMFPITISTSDK